MDWVARKADINDRDSVIELLKDSFGAYWAASQNIFTRDFWNWLYKDNPYGGSINLVAEGRGRIVGHFPNVLGQLKVNENVYPVGTVLHLATHPDYRKKGIFKKLGELSIEELKKSNVPFSIAFPNDKSRPGFIKKLGFSPIVTLPLLVKPLRIKNSLKTIIKNQFLSFLLWCLSGFLYHIAFHRYGLRVSPGELKIERRVSFGSEFDLLWDRARSQAKVMAPRNSRFLNWRFISKPGQRYQIFVALRNNELSGYMVCRQAGIFSLRVGIIMDYFVLPGEDRIISSLLDAVIAEFIKEKMDLCISGCLKNNAYYKSFKGAGFLTVPKTLTPRKLILVGRVNQDTLDKEVFLNGKNWFLSFGDWDNF